MALIPEQVASGTLTYTEFNNAFILGTVDIKTAILYANSASIGGDIDIADGAISIDNDDADIDARINLRNSNNVDASFYIVRGNGGNADKTFISTDQEFAIASGGVSVTSAGFSMNNSQNITIAEDLTLSKNLSVVNVDMTAQTDELVAGESLVNGDLCYLKSDGKYWKCDADTEATVKPRLVLCLDTIAADATGTFLIKGRWTTTGLTAGSVYFNSATAGGISATAPTTGQFAKVIGTAESTTVLEFNPQTSWVEVG